ncbi:MAG: GH36-type glycosyl hydrolase domain-containing protein [Oscillospiraceae bacterium]
MTQKDTGLYIELGTLGNYARNTAAGLEASGCIRGRSVAAGGEAVLRRLKSKVRELSAWRGAPSEADEWFSDNWYLAEREGSDGVRCFELAGSFPRAAGTHRAVISEAAGALVRSGRGEVTPERIRLFLDEYQKVSEISERELAVFIPVLKLELISLLDAVFPVAREKSGEDKELAMLLKNIFTSLRLLAGADMSDIIEAVNRVEQTLREDPAGVYPLMDEETRHSYRVELAKLAKKEKISEFEAARTVLRLSEGDEACHVGRFIFTQPLGKPKRERSGGWYIAVNTIASVFMTVLTGVLLRSIAAPLLLLVPISEIVKNVTDFVVLHVVHPRRLPRMSFEGGIPKSGRTICVISSLLTDSSSGPKLARLLEEYRLSNRDAGENLLFGILADLKEGKQKREKDDAVIIDEAREAVNRLNKEYGGGFFLLIRDREYSESDGCFMGRERKRGAITELVRLLSGKKSAVRVEAGDAEALREINFILTLDSDTRLTAGSAREMIGAAMHPVNIPVIDAKKGRVVQGYGIFEPRVATELSSAGKSDFSKVFAGQGGVDPYNSAVSDVYQDLFGEGTFMGKGLINVPVYLKLMESSIPDNTVLSHDILEGAYMRCAFLSDTELTDGCPYKVTSYFARQERWTRGDWQNLRWMLPRVKNKDGALVKNCLNDISRWKIFDNLRRSLVPLMAFLSVMIGMLMSGPVSTALIIIAVACVASGLLLTSAELIIRHDGSSRARFQSAIISGAAGAVMRTAIRLMLLPAEGWVQLRAIVTALYRMMFSHRKMLAWVTSSEMERRHGNTVGVNYLKLAACPAAGIAAIVLSPHAAAAAVGLVWIFAPAYAWALSREIKKEKSISQIDRGFLLSCAGDIWRYFSDFLTPEDNFLPPDNVQEEPAVGLAHRTSPTNIGLCLLSALAASDLGIIDEKQAAGVIGRTLDSVEKLEKWNGHLYNWYDTRSLSPLEPRYVSTVDSGNLTGCLIAVTQALNGMGEADLAARCRALVDAVDFRPLFDGKRKLFYIGWDMEKNAPTQGWYDLLASEARETSFIAVALGQVPRKHWRRLGRALVSQDSYSGMASWTGTMFEYLMPNILLPCYENSLIYESSRFCIYAQKRAHKGIPWGISESAFYAFDPGLSYRYKAHGVQRLALKRKMGLDKVVSPYSTFLALPLDTQGAVKNLRRLERLGLTGKYGFYEAADFTPSRVSGKYEVVRTYMAHHLGMSITSIANTLCGDIFTRRFMGDVRMAAFSELLQERVPEGRIVLRQPPREIPEKPKRAESAGYLESIREIDAYMPRCLPLSNGTYSVLLLENGKTRSTWRSLELTRFEPDALGGSGMEFYLKTPDGVFPILPAPGYQDGTYGAEFSDSCGKILFRYGQYAASMTVSVPTAGAGEIRTIDVAVSGKTEQECSVICVFEPVLDRPEDYFSHPAFSRLSLETELYSGGLVMRRRGRGKKSEVFMALSCSGNAELRTERDRGDPVYIGRLSKTSPEMRVACEAKLDLKGGRGGVSFALAPGSSKEECLSDAKRMLEHREKTAVSRIAASALMLGLKTSDVRSALGLITGLLFGGTFSDDRRRLIENGEYKKEDLWRFGISGDLPLLAARVESTEQIEASEELLRRHAFLSENGVRSDLALLITDGGDYRSAQKGAVQELLHRMGRDGAIGAKGGVHLVNASETSAEAVIAMADVFVPLDGSAVPNERHGRMPLRQPEYIRGSEPMGFRLERDGVFRLAVSDTLPPLSWSHVLANKDFGFLATEAGTGYMWYKNSREMKINRWLGDPLTTAGTERLELYKDGKRISLFADGDGRSTMVEYGFGWASWEKELGGVKSCVTAFVPGDAAARVMIIRFEGETSGCKLDYYTELTLGGDNRLSARTVTWQEDGALFARRPGGEYEDAVFCVAASEKPEGFTCDRSDWLSGGLNGTVGAGNIPCAAARYSAARELVIVTGCAPADKIKQLCDMSAAERELNKTREYWREAVTPVTIETGDENIDGFINGWALYQTYCCRVLARTALYQNGGAIGFRDQLQDICALSAFKPETAARQIRLAAEHQYKEGDVQHWWHPGPYGDKGVRTRCSDDLLWLPYALCDYVEKTGDHGLCRAKAHYLMSRPLEKDEEDRYESPGRSPDKDTLLGHCIRAADMFISRGLGSHGLALMGSGDWNDGMDAVGREGRGESVWLSFFASIVLKRLAELCAKEGEQGRAMSFRDYSEMLLNAAERAWSGQWYLRGYYDDGEPLGAPGDRECEIDSIAQSFSVFAGADRNRSSQALSSAYARLFDVNSGVVRLFTPPFDDGEKNPGYIRGYAPGYRENGGQYTHGAVWLAMAMLRAGETARGAELLAALSPGGRDIKKYKAEPYVIAADVYSAPGHEGRGGWTWYTGSAGWYFRAVTEELMGLHVRDGVLYIEPKLPAAWGKCSASVRTESGELKIEIDPPRGNQVTVNGKPFKNDGYPLKIHNKFISSAENM